MNADTTVNAAATIGTLFWGAVLVSVLVIALGGISAIVYVWFDEGRHITLYARIKAYYTKFNKETRKP